MRSIISTVDLDDRSLVDKARRSTSMAGLDLASKVMPEKPYSWRETNDHEWRLIRSSDRAASDKSEPFKVVALDFGMKWNIGRALTEAGCEVTVVPGRASADEITALKPEGVFLSNGPGDPEPLEFATRTIESLLGKTPIFGICLGHQLLGRALGAKTFKLKFGHRGANHPVRDERTGRVEITTQNHGFAVDPDSLPKGVEATHVNLNDGTLEGLRHEKAKAFSVQYHPEASAGPHDAAYLFGEFVEMMIAERRANVESAGRG
jgi:carbamoyl-phosphate synthase small subunit